MSITTDCNRIAKERKHSVIFAKKLVVNPPYLVSRPVPSHGCRNLYGYDLSRCLELLRTTWWKNKGMKKLWGKHDYTHQKVNGEDKIWEIGTSIFSAWYKIRKGTGPTHTFARGRCLFSFVPSIIWLKKSLTETHFYNFAVLNYHQSMVTRADVSQKDHNPLPPALALNCSALPMIG